MVRRIVAVAELDERPDAAAATRALAAAGDEDNAWVLDEWRQGRVLVTRITVVVYADDARGERIEARRVLDEVWLERDAVPAVEEQVADIAPSELVDMARELRENGVAVDEGNVLGSYLHVELGDRLRDALTRA